MAYKRSELVALQVLYISLTVVPYMGSHILDFQCIDNVGRIPGINAVILKAGPYKPLNPTATDISAVECAALCARTQLGTCQSYAYNPSNQYCFTRNVTLYQAGVLCGIRVDWSRRRCSRSGDTFVAFGGKARTMMECICGGDSNKWPVMKSTLYYNCIEWCNNTYPCAVDMDLVNNCKMCNQSISVCPGTPSINTEYQRIVCMPIFAMPST